MKIFGVTLIALAIANTAGCASVEKSNTSQRQGVDKASDAGVDYEYRASDVVTLKYANARPLTFSADATPADKVLSVMGMPSFKVAPAGSFTSNQLRTATAEQTRKYISAVAAPAGPNGKDFEAFGLNVVGGTAGATGMALSLLAGSPKYDPRVNLGYFVCFERVDQTADTSAAVSNCAKKMNLMFDATVTNVTKVISLENGQFRTGSVLTNAGEKTAKVFIGRRGVLAADGFAPSDRGGYASRIVAIPINSETTSTMDKILFLDNGNVTPAEVAGALAKHLPDGSAFYLPDRVNGPVGVY